MRIKVIPAGNDAGWSAVLGRMPQFDFYHLPGYHRLMTGQNGGEGVLLTYMEGEEAIALPLLLRSVPANGGGLYGALAATSVYGYAGPLATAGCSSVELLLGFHSELHREVARMGIVSLSSKLHPIFENHRYLAGIGVVSALGPTVSIDLTAPLDQQFASYRKSHRYEIRRARALGMTVRQANDHATLCLFCDMYRATMQRLNAAERYHFDLTYFERLAAVEGTSLQVFVAEWCGEACAAGIFMHTGDIVQYHLSASDSRFARLAPAKVVIDEARMWATQVGAKYLHLGGGVASREDLLYQMKSGFSQLRHRFHVWDWRVPF